MLPFPPLTRQAKITVSAESSGLPLPDFLTSRFNYLPRERWLALIAENRLLLDGSPATSESCLAVGQCLEFLVPPAQEPEVDWTIFTIAEHPPYLLLAKPGNLPCHPAGRFFNHTLWAWLKQYRQLEQVHFLNRLDRETSGLTLLATEARAAAVLQKNLASHGLKQYLVLVHGHCPEQFQAEGFLSPDLESPVRKMRKFTPAASGQPEKSEWCSTSFSRLDLSPDGKFSLLLATLKTGRLHQIRATLHSLGFPVVGDKLYGQDPNLYLRYCRNLLTEEDLQSLIMPRQALHAWKMTIPWPSQANPETFTAPPPNDFLNACQKLSLVFKSASV